MGIRSVVDSVRGCGWRKPGGMYLVSGRLTFGCGKLPFPLVSCPTCGQGFHPSRGWTWIDAIDLVDAQPCRKEGDGGACRFCPLDYPIKFDRVGLLWVGEKFYETPGAFLDEGMAQGISRRIAQIPRGFEVGRTWVFLAHRKAILDPETGERSPGVFAAFIPERIEYIVDGTETEEQIDALEKRGLTPVRVQRDEEIIYSLADGTAPEGGAE